MEELDKSLDNGYIIKISDLAFMSMDISKLRKWCKTNNLQDSDWLFIGRLEAMQPPGSPNMFKFRYEADAMSYMLTFPHLVARN